MQGSFWHYFAPAPAGQLLALTDPVCSECCSNPSDFKQWAGTHLTQASVDRASSADVSPFTEGQAAVQATACAAKDAAEHDTIDRAVASLQKAGEPFACHGCQLPSTAKL